MELCVGGCICACVCKNEEGAEEKNGGRERDTCLIHAPKHTHTYIHTPVPFLRIALLWVQGKSACGKQLLKNGGGVRGSDCNGRI